MQCAEKKKYPLKKTAKKVARERGLRVYKCEKCGSYHLTSKALRGAGKIDWNREVREVGEQDSGD